MRNEVGVRVIGIDPGYERLGVAVIEKPNKGKEFLIFSDCFKTSPKKPHSERLLLLSNFIDNCLNQYKPDIMALESLFFNTNQKTAVKVAEARGVILSRAAHFDVETIEINPLQVKMAITGYGRCEKRQMISNIPRIIKIEKKITYDDEFDAIAVGLTCTAALKTLLIKKQL